MDVPPQTDINSDHILANDQVRNSQALSQLEKYGIDIESIGIARIFGKSNNPLVFYPTNENGAREIVILDPHSGISTRYKITQPEGGLAAVYVIGSSVNHEFGYAVISVNGLPKTLMILDPSQNAHEITLDNTTGIDKVDVAQDDNGGYVVYVTFINSQLGIYKLG